MADEIQKQTGGAQSASFCPYCRKIKSSDDRSIWPFCSARCKTADLGAWASEQYTIAGTPLNEDVVAAEDLTEEELDALYGDPERKGDD